MTRDYSVPVLPNEGKDDYARYMRTDALLSLQRTPEEMVHRDELLFQTVHQATELWLKHACFEVDEATRLMTAGEPDGAARLLARASLGVRLATDQLEMMHHLAPWDFQLIRTVLGHGSGLESPGWREVRRVGTAHAQAFAALGVDLVAVYQGSPDTPLYRLGEAMIEWDERVSLWRARHLKIATRVIGHNVVGTKGNPVEMLTKLLSHKFFPELWAVRTELTLLGPMSQA